MKFLVVGLGSMGKRRVRNLLRLGHSEIAGVDPRPDRREEAVGKYGIATFATFKDGMSWGPDALIISTPPNMHMSFANTAVASGKHFFCEASTSTAGMLEVLRLARQNSVVAAPSCTMRYHPSVQKLKQLVTSGEIGAVLSYTHHAGQWLPDWHPAEDYRKFYVCQRETGACREIVPFELTWLNWVIDSAINRVTAMKSKLSNLECDIDDVYHLVMQHESGAIGHLQIDVLARFPVRHCRILGTDGVLEWSITERAVRHYRADTRAWTSFNESVPRVEQGYSEMSNEVMYEAEIGAYIDAICGRSAWSNPLEDDIATLEILLAAERASDSGATERLVKGEVGSAWQPG